MARVSTVEAYAKRVACHALRNAGRSIRNIARELDLTVSSVQNYLASPVPLSSPGAAIDAALALKSMPENMHRGSLEIRAMLLNDHDAVPSQRTLDQVFSDAGLAKKAQHRQSIRRPYHTEARPSRYLDQFQIDTVKMVLGSETIELLSVRDVYTGCHLLLRHDATQRGMVRSLATIRNVFGGLPKVFQADNGTTDFSMSRRHMLRPWHKYIFTHGTDRLQFIPEAEPCRNGSVESFHDWLKDEQDNHGRAYGLTADTLDTWLLDRLAYYNYYKPLSSTKMTPRAASNGRFSLAGLHTSLDLSFDDHADGCVSFIRYVSRSVDRASGAVVSVAVVKSPAMVFVVPAEFEGGYLRFDCFTDGRGMVIAPAPSDVQSAMRSGSRSVNGRLADRGAVGVVVGSFASPFASPNDGVIAPLFDCELLAGYEGIATDPAMLVRQWRKVLKQRMPSILPSDYNLVVGQDGAWECWRGDDLVWTEQSSPDVLEHALDVL